MSVYLDKKSSYPHLKVNWNVLMCKICIARCLVVDIFPWCNANFVPFPSGTLVAHRMRNGSIVFIVWTERVGKQCPDVISGKSRAFKNGGIKTLGRLQHPPSIRVKSITLMHCNCRCRGAGNDCLNLNFRQNFP